MRLTHGSVFSGVGGFELGAQRAGIETLWNCELQEFNRRILKQHFPKSKQYEDITTLSHPEPVDIISGGFPCQDITSAWKESTGIVGSRSGLWGEFARIIHEGRPLYVVGENSTDLTKRGFEKVLYDLSEIGYDAEWQCLSGTTFGVQQRRERIYFIAYARHLALQGQHTGPVFRQQELQEQLAGVYPGWLRRSDIPQPRTIRSADDVPHLVDRIKACGNAVMPLIAEYLFRCILSHYNRTTALCRNLSLN
ncbi:DNA (cytosine-5)-methyltransferase 1 [Pontibacter mucosus]|uniref:DNA (cytosine-5-)-methyltransferase n=1 Tax=Pontibacter mucosus TaxID=1649266 RepID=A0A2T5YD79_9BACT|nr:DNA (cytosine-5)-methyltransferase 1 [Pontibacter mucosus]